MRFICRFFGVILLLMAGGEAAFASLSATAALCERAAQQASLESGVPLDIMAALTLTETGRRLEGSVRPWPWSVNSEGEGSWFDDPASAIAFAQSRVDAGRHNLDIGCFQLNYRWHGQHFTSVRQMFDPLENARYAADFVRQLFYEIGDWRAAAGAFHSRTPVHANRYLARFDTLRGMLTDQDQWGLQGAPETYNSFAALSSGTRRSRIMRERVMILGAPLGTEVTGTAGSLAAVGRANDGLRAPPGPLIVAGPPLGTGPLGANGSLWQPR